MWEVLRRGETRHEAGYGQEEGGIDFDASASSSTGREGQAMRACAEFND